MGEGFTESGYVPPQEEGQVIDGQSATTPEQEAAERVNEHLGDVAVPADEKSADTHASEQAPQDIPKAEGTALQAETASAEPDSDDGHWDKQKARTMADVLQQDKGFARSLGYQQRDIDRYRAGKDDYKHYYGDDKLVEAQDGVDWAESTHNRFGVNSPEQIDKLTTRMDLAEARRESAWREHLAGVPKHFEERGDYLSAESDKILAPFVELYEADPDRYANMPTAEFVNIAKEFTRLDNGIDDYERASEWLPGLLEIYEQTLKDKKEYEYLTEYSDDIDVAVSIVGVQRYVDAEAGNLIAEWHSLDGEEARFEYGLRERTEHKIGFIKQQMEAGAANVEKLRQRRAAMLTGPSESGNPESNQHTA